MQDEVRNPGWWGRFTCPGCGESFEAIRPEKTHSCPNCGAAIECRTITEPTACCRLIEGKTNVEK